MARGVALLSAFASALLGLAIGVFILVGPTGTECRTSIVQPGETASGDLECRSVNMLQSQRDLFPAPILFIATWSLAPVVAPVAVRMRMRGSPRSPGLIAGAMAVEAAGIISMGGGFLYALFVAPLLLLCFITTSAISVEPRASTDGARTPSMG